LNESHHTDLTSFFYNMQLGKSNNNSYYREIAIYYNYKIHS